MLFVRPLAVVFRSSVVRLSRRAALALVLVPLLASQSMAAPAAQQPLSPQATMELVTEIASMLEADYIYEDRGREIGAAMLEHVGTGAYAGVVTPVELATRLTHDLYEASSDAHLRVWYEPGATEDTAIRRRRRPDPTYGLRSVEILEGNVGYLDLRGFAGSADAKARADTAFAFLEGVDALIIDLRRNQGGGPWMVQYLSALLFDEPTHLVSTWLRGMDAPQERWSAEDLSVAPRPDMPVYVLTSRRTFSAAESFTFGLLTNDRITVVGERTGGGGHFGGTEPLPGGFVMFVPVGRTYDPRTDEGWESDGIAPHVAVPADDALVRAHEMALGATLEGAGRNRLVGAWTGSVETGSGPARITLRVSSSEDGALAGSLVDHRRQREITLDVVQVDSNTVRCTFAPAGIEMTLRLEQDGEVLVGTYGQEDDEQSLRLERR